MPTKGYRHAFLRIALLHQHVRTRYTNSDAIEPERADFRVHKDGVALSYESSFLRRAVRRRLYLSACKDRFKVPQRSVGRRSARDTALA